ncbi:MULTISPECIES: hypothetical protein [unclassified Massilia]|uniref:hypothetical protein n=1 Tax=unclassified Massilia TaxID=2609279 RepID=UPI001780B640|nr:MULTISPECIES: hypothetical protein [unclassified Massilia]MBD8531692.1 hypothetical protein [Massilia sp. CFBP 13647]MBD8675137.1 hypothetical protein [Massilia sp. CFBP 13721]
MNPVDNRPYGFRDPNNEELYTTPRTDFKNVTPDGVSAAVEGYFRFPAIWLGIALEDEQARFFDPKLHHEIVYRRDLSCNIKVCAKRDGTFLFDFSQWPLAPIVRIPGYEHPNEMYRIPPENEKQRKLADSYGVLRAQVMNVHQACLSTAEERLFGIYAPAGVPVASQNTHKSLSFDEAHGYHDNVYDMHALARNVANNKDNVSKPALHRRVVDLSAIDLSFTLLDNILRTGDSGIVQIIEAVFIAARRDSEGRSGECVMLAWGASEQLVSILWNRLIVESKKDKDIGEKIGGERLKKLRGRDYTASVMVEILEMTGKVDSELYRHLEIARKTRNKWAHEMRMPKHSEAYVCLEAARRLLKLALGIDLLIQSGGSGGGPTWWIWGWERTLRNGGP